MTMSIQARVRGVATLAAAGILAMSVSACGTQSSGATPAAAPVSSPSQGETVGSTVAGFPAIPDTVARVDPSVVTVAVGRTGIGSGVVYREGGFVVTNAHVVGKATRVSVELADGSRTPAEVLATDEITDLAVLRTERRDLPAATFSTVQPRVGELVLAMGSPLGFQNSVTAGIVSGLGREIPGAAAQGARSLVDLIQTDAAISPGNSGGALVNIAGEVVGINEAYIPPATGAVSLGFAIPAVTVVGVVDQLIADGRATHPFLGVATTTLTSQIARAFGLSATEGALIQSVRPNSPAVSAGLRAGDVIVTFNSESIRSADELLGSLRGVDPGDEVGVHVRRGGELLKLSVAIGTLAPQNP